MVAATHVFDRLLLLSEILQGTTGSTTAGSLALTLQERGSPICSRTIHRDLQLLQSRGFVRAIGTGKRGGPGVRWQWIADRQLLRA